LAINHYKFNFGRIDGSFIITQLEYAGNYDAEASFSLTLISAGALGFVAL